MAGTSEYRAVTLSIVDLVNAIAVDVFNYADKFRGEELITEVVYNTVTDASIKQDNTGRARDIVKCITANVKANPGPAFTKLLKALRDLNLKDLAERITEKNANNAMNEYLDKSSHQPIERVNQSDSQKGHQLPSKINAMNEHLEESICQPRERVNQSDRPREGSTKNPVVVMVAGLSRRGKSTILNNLFGLDFEARVSAKIVTKQIDVRVIVKQCQEFIVIDTPGFSEFNKTHHNLLQQIKEYVLGINFTLIYCIAVATVVSYELTEQVVKDLNHNLNKEIWKNSMIVMSFSDIVRSEFRNKEDYIQHLRQHCRKFQRILECTGVTDVQVRTIFDYKTDYDRKVNTLDGVVAVPVAKEISNNMILPDIHCSWNDIVFNELLKKVSSPMTQMEPTLSGASKSFSRLSLLFSSLRRNPANKIKKLRDRAEKGKND